VRCPADGYAFVTPDALAEADDDAFLGATIAGRYVIRGRLGAGSMGTVYRARQDAMGRTLALKILRSDRAFDAQAKARFTREARAMSLLTSPHTVTVFDFGEIPEERGEGGEPAPGAGSLYLAMAMLEGESLGQRLKVRRRLRIEDAARVTRHALISLAEAHEKGVIHRDLKPDNLFLTRTPDGEICKVLDFGIAKVVSDQTGVDALETQAGTVFGTPRYMSPEQAQAKPLDARSDLYALGVLLYQMIVGRPPFVDDDAVVVMARHIKTPPTPPIEAAPDAGIPRPLSDLVARVLAKDPNDRPPSARAFIAELDMAMDPKRAYAPAPAHGQTSVATGEMTAVVREDLERLPPLPGGPPPLGRSKRALLVAGTAGITLVGGLLALGVLGRGVDTPRPGPTDRSAERPSVADGAIARPLAPAIAESSVAPADSAAAAPAPSAVEPTPDASGAPSAQGAASTSGHAAAPRKPGAAPASTPKKTYVRFE